MKTQLDALASELGELQAAGHTAIALPALITYVNGLAQSARTSDPESERQRIRLNFEGQLEQYKAAAQNNVELFKAVIEAGHSALKALSVFNGAATVSILAFLGNALTHPTKEAMLSVPIMGKAMVWFAFGVGLSAVGFAARYLSQASYHGTLLGAEKGQHYGNVFRNVAIGAAIASLLVFFVGVCLAYGAVR